MLMALTMKVLLLIENGNPWKRSKMKLFTKNLGGGGVKKSNEGGGDLTGFQERK